MAGAGAALKFYRASVSESTSAGLAESVTAPSTDRKSTTLHSHLQTLQTDIQLQLHPPPLYSSDVARAGGMGQLIASS